MSCKKCDEVQDRGDIAYLRVDKANVGLLGCDEHLNMMGSKIAGKEVNQVWVRVLAHPDNKKYYL
jgi:hypothetical protein